MNAIRRIIQKVGRKKHDPPVRNEILDVINNALRSRADTGLAPQSLDPILSGQGQPDFLTEKELSFLFDLFEKKKIVEIKMCEKGKYLDVTSQWFGCQVNHDSHFFSRNGEIGNVSHDCEEHELWPETEKQKREWES